MRPLTFIFVLWVLLAAFSSLAGCSYVTVDSRHYLAVPVYPPTDPATIQILHAAPVRPHERLGEIELTPEGNPPIAEIEAKLRQAAADMGADAAVIVADTTRLTGEYVTGPWWGRQVYPQYGRVIIAVAIRYVK